MTERKPRQQSFPSWIDQQIADAENRGVFENLPGAGQPLNIKPTGDGDFGQAWMRDYARREGVSPEEFLPTPLKLRREIEQLTETVGEMRSEAEVERHDCVHATDGEIGQVEGFVVDPADHKVTHVVLQEGYLWGRKRVAIPASPVASVNSGIQLNITKKQVEELPSLDPAR